MDAITCTWQKHSVSGGSWSSRDNSARMTWGSNSILRVFSMRCGQPYPNSKLRLSKEPRLVLGIAFPFMVMGEDDLGPLGFQLLDPFNRLLCQVFVGVNTAYVPVVVEPLSNLSLVAHDAAIMACISC